MASSGPLGAGTGGNVTGIGTLAWFNASNITANDASYAFQGAFDAAATTNWLKATNFGFSIPSGATVDGITVEWDKYFEDAFGDGATAYDAGARIVKGDTIGSTDNSKVDVWPTAATFSSYGSNVYLWGETWTYSDINSTTFGAAISANMQATGGALVNCFVDYCRITVYYTEGGAGANPKSVMRGIMLAGPMRRVVL